MDVKKLLGRTYLAAHTILLWADAMTVETLYGGLLGLPTPLVVAEVVLEVVAVLRHSDLSLPELARNL